MYAKLDYDKSRFIRCARCGVLKHRTYNPRISEADKEAIRVCFEHTGFGAIRLSKLLKIHKEVIRRVIRQCRQSAQPTFHPKVIPHPNSG